jgi:hypothetical protein
MMSLLVGLIVSLTAAGCVSLPSGGPVLPYSDTQGANGQGQPYMQIVPPSPGPGWDPSEIVEGFLAASASFIGQQKVAREYLTPEASRGWQPNWSATVFANGPQIVADNIAAPALKGAKGPKGQETASVTIGGHIQATLSGAGTYAVAATTPKGPFRYDLVKRDGQWRISNLYNHPLLLTHTEFTADYQLRNLYFFDPASGKELVPDPVYVPLQLTQTDLLNGLVQDLIKQPPDWLGRNSATRTAFPKGTTLVGNVTVDGGTASVTLGGAATRAPASVKEQISSQLWWTLNLAGQGQQQVQSIALYTGDKPFAPNGQGNAVQNHAKYGPADNPSGVFYYLRTNGQLMKVAGPNATPVKVASLGAGYTGLAVSPDGQYVAALRGDGNVYTGEISASRLTYRPVGSGFTSLSWDRNDDLWAAGSAGVVIVSAAAKSVGASAPVVIPVQGDPCRSPLGDVTQVQVAPDGVRVALVFGGQQQALAFGAIVMAGQSAAAQTPQTPPLATVQVSPFIVCGTPGSAFRALSWYGAENVIALTQPAGALTEYPVNGSTPTPIPGRPGIQSVAAYLDGSTGGLVAGMDGGAMSVDTSLQGAWSQLNYPGQFPTYPG